MEFVLMNVIQMSVIFIFYIYTYNFILLQYMTQIIIYVNNVMKVVKQESVFWQKIMNIAYNAKMKISIHLLKKEAYQIKYMVNAIKRFL